VKCLLKCKVIDHLAVTDHNKILLGDSGACRALITMLRIHHNHSALVVAHVAVSCAKLCKGCEQNVGRFMDQSSCELFLDCLEEHKSSDNATISLYQCLYYLSTAPAAKCLILTKEDIFKDIIRFIPRVKHDGLGVFWCMRLVAALAWDADSRDMFHRTNAHKVLPTAGLGLKDDRHVVLATLLALDTVLTGYTGEEECFGRFCSSDTCELMNYALEHYSNDERIAMTVTRLLNTMAGKEDGVSTGHTSPGSPVGRVAPPGRRKSAWATLKGKFFSGGSGDSTLLSASTSQNSMEDARGGEKAKQMRGKLGQGGACSHLPKVLASHVDNLELVTCACDALQALSMDESNLEAMGAAGAVEVLVSTLKRYGHSDRHVMTSLSQMIASLASVSRTHSNQFGALGACDLLATALSVHCCSAEAAQAGCRAVYNLALRNISNQNLFGDAGISITLKTVLQQHCLNLSVIQNAISAVFAVLNEHYKNCSKFAAITSPQVFVDLLTEFSRESEVVRHTLWALNCVRRHGQNNILVVDSHDTSGEIALPEADKTGGEVLLALNADRVSDIVGAIQHHSHDADVALHGCDLIASVLIWSDAGNNNSNNSHGRDDITAADGRVYLLNDSHAQLSGYFDAAGVCDMLSSILQQHAGNVAIAASALRAIGLQLRAQASSAVVTIDEQREYKCDRMTRFGSVHDCELVLKLVHKYGGHDKEILKYATLVLSNVLFACADERKLAVIGDAGNVKYMVKSLNGAASDQGVARFGCLLISRLSVGGAGAGTGSLSPVVLQAGAAGFLANVLNTHLQVPAVTENALNALHALCRLNTAATEQLGNFDLCESLASVFTEYPVTAINEPVAFSLCRAVASLADENGLNCMKFGKVGTCEDIVKQLIHFLNGPYIAIIRDSNTTGTGEEGRGRAAYCELVALWSCRAIGCLAKDPSTWPAREGQLKVTGGGFNENRVTLGDVGACEAISQVLKNYSGDEAITNWALWAALNLSEGDESNAGRFVRAGALKSVKEAALHFADNAVLLSSAEQIERLLQAGSK